MYRAHLFRIMEYCSTFDDLSIVNAPCCVKGMEVYSENGQPLTDMVHLSHFINTTGGNRRNGKNMG